MKRSITVLAIIMLGFSFGLHAQTEKQTWLLGGRLAFQSTKGSSLFELSPNLGYFVANNVALGLQASVLAGDGYSTWLFGPFGRYYFAGNETGKFFAQAGVNVGGAKDTDTKFGYGVGAGYAIFLNHSVALELGGSYNKIGENSGYLVLGAGFQIHFKKNQE